MHYSFNLIIFPQRKFKQIMKKILATILLASVISLGNAQVKAPQPSPSSTVKQNIGLSEVIVDYSRPSANERKIFGNLVPMGQLWRTGANGSTDITFSAPAVFAGQSVPAGKYALYTIPSIFEWDVILYTDTEQWGAPKELDESLIVARATVKASKSLNYVETFNISFDDLKTDQANLNISWENTTVKIPIVMDSRKEVLESITTALKSKTVKAGDYYQSASYYYQEKIDMKKALSYVEKANKMQPDTFYILKLQAEIEAATGKTKNAIATAKKSMELAKKAGNEDYVKINADNIEKWSNSKYKTGK